MSPTEGRRTMCEAFQRSARIDPDAVALRTPGGTQELTWREYAEQVRRVAAGLTGLGVGRGDTVSLMMANRIEFYPLEIGAQHVGATSFSVYNTLPAEQLGYFFGDARVEQIKRFRILPILWEPGGDEITLTMKLKRKPIHAKYAAEIEELYVSEPGPHAHQPGAASTAQPA